jgi:hypothetical protein
MNSPKLRIPKKSGYALGFKPKMTRQSAGPTGVAAENDTPNSSKTSMMLDASQDWKQQKCQTKIGWWLTYPSEKYESQLGLLFPVYGKS